MDLADNDWIPRRYDRARSVTPGPIKQQKLDQKYERMVQMKHHGCPFCQTSAIIIHPGPTMGPVTLNHSLKVINGSSGVSLVLTSIRRPGSGYIIREGPEKQSKRTIQAKHLVHLLIKTSPRIRLPGSVTIPVNIEVEPRGSVGDSAITHQKIQIRRSEIRSKR